MACKNIEKFKEELKSSFEINPETFRCYNLESNQQIKVITFGKQEWKDCHIGILINDDFHVLGVGSLSFINEDVKALYVPMVHTIPCDKQILKESTNTNLNEKQQESIIIKLTQIFSKDEK